MYIDCGFFQTNKVLWNAFSDIVLQFLNSRKSQTQWKKVCVAESESKTKHNTVILLHPAPKLDLIFALHVNISYGMQYSLYTSVYRVFSISNQPFCISVPFSNLNVCVCVVKETET